jgi:hypothetical protein
MAVKFVVTTDKTDLVELKNDGWYIVGVDGTVPGAESFYDELYDHHKVGGRDVQILEMYDLDIEKRRTDTIVLVTTMVDADAICSAWWWLNYCRFGSWQHFVFRDFLIAVSYECDHLAVPMYNYEPYEKNDPLAVVNYLKEKSNELVSQLGLSNDRRQWTLSDKKEFASKAFESGVDFIHELYYEILEFEPDESENWNAIVAARESSKDYMKNLNQMVEKICDENRISIYRGCLIFSGQNINSYVDPRAWLWASEKLGFNPTEAVTLTERAVWVDNEFKGISYTIGSVPLHPKQKGLDYTLKVFGALTDAEKNKNPEFDKWGGRATVGGSSWNHCSSLTEEEVIDIVLANLD